MMKICRSAWILAAACTMSAAQAGPPAAPKGNSWIVTFEDDFNGRLIDGEKWFVHGDAPRKGGWWTKSACQLDGKGHLVIRTAREGDKLISGCVETKGRFEQKYGYWECRAKIPESAGHWAAFWLMCDSMSKTGDEGRDGSEIDIMEVPKRDGTVNHAIHWDGYGREHQVKGSEAKVRGVLKRWATFSLLWTPECYVFHVNGRETWRSTAGGVCQVPVYAMLSTEIGTWAGEIDEHELPDRFVVDYVRVYDLAKPRSTEKGLP